MGPFFKKFFTDETVFVRITRSLILTVGGGGIAFAKDIADVISPGHEKVVKGAALFFVLLAPMFAAGDKNLPEVKP